jgi:hypothetical protein
MMERCVVEAGSERTIRTSRCMGARLHALFLNGSSRLQDRKYRPGENHRGRIKLWRTSKTDGKWPSEMTLLYGFYAPARRGGAEECLAICRLPTVKRQNVRVGALRRMQLRVSSTNGTREEGQIQSTEYKVHHKLNPGIRHPLN